jgi:hypothetical protein
MTTATSTEKRPNARDILFDGTVPMPAEARSLAAALSWNRLRRSKGWECGRMGGCGESSTHPFSRSVQCQFRIVVSISPDNPLEVCPVLSFEALPIKEHL